MVFKWVGLWFLGNGFKSVAAMVFKWVAAMVLNG